MPIPKIRLLYRSRILNSIIMSRQKCDDSWMFTKESIFASAVFHWLTHLTNLIYFLRNPLQLKNNQCSSISSIFPMKLLTSSRAFLNAEYLLRHPSLAHTPKNRKKKLMTFFSIFFPEILSKYCFWQSQIFHYSYSAFSILFRSFLILIWWVLDIFGPWCVWSQFGIHRTFQYFLAFFVPISLHRGSRFFSCCAYFQPRLIDWVLVMW